MNHNLEHQFANLIYCTLVLMPRRDMWSIKGHQRNLRFENTDK